MPIFKLRTKKLVLGFSTAVFFRTCIQLLHFFIIGLIGRSFSSESFAIWMLLGQAIFFISILDFGLGGGALRNELTQREAKEGNKLFLSSFYFMFILAIFLAFGLFGFGQIFLSKSAFLPLLLLIVRHPFTIYGTGLLATQKLAEKSFYEFWEVLVFSAVAFLCIRLEFSEANIIMYSFSSFFLMSVISFSLYLKREKWSLKLYPIREIFMELKPFLFLNTQFWLMNLLSLGLFTLSPFLVTAWFGLEEAGRMSVYHKIISFALGIHFVWLNALWSGISESIVRKDRQWIISKIRFTTKATIFLGALLSCFLYFFHGWFLEVWIGKNLTDNIAMLLFSFAAILSAFTNIYSIVLNAFNLLNRQIFFLIMTVFLNIIFGYICSRFWGSLGIIFGFCLSIFPMMISNYKQVKELLNNQLWKAY